MRAHDPQALDRARREFLLPGITWCEAAEDVTEEADALVLVTAWPQYRDLDWEDLARRMHQPLVVDGRNSLDREALVEKGFTVLGMGR